MGHDLAKKLEEAGFPKTEQVLINYEGEICGRSEDEHDKCDDYDCGLKYIEYPNPTLEELIDACGDRFHALYRVMDEWFAKDDRGFEIKGKTKKEAVAKLWLKLKKNFKK